LEDRACPALNLISIDIAAGPFSSDPSNNANARSFVEYNGHLYFAANSNDGFGVELHRYDPSSHTVTRVTDINSGAASSNPAWLTVYNNELYFAADGGASNGGVELWRYNATTNTASRVTDINSGAASSNPAWLTVYNNVLYFAADGGASNGGVELWRYNATTNTASRVTDINSGAGDSNPAWLTVYNNVLYFAASDGSGQNNFGVELWRYNATTNTASRVTDIYSGPASSNPAWLTVYNNDLYFAADDGTNGVELWRYNATTNTASRVTDINSGSGSSNPAWLTVYNNVLYFAADDGGGQGNFGVELWRYNATTNNTSRVTDINIGPANSNPAWLTVYNNELYFAADDGGGQGNFGVELWRYNATTNNTSRVTDINSGSANSNPKWLTVFNNSLFFNADGGNIGAELRILYDQQPVSLTIISGGSQSTAVNTAFNNQIKVKVLDQYNIPVPNSPVSFFLPSGGASGTLSGGSAGFTDANGEITKTLTANTVAGTYSIVVQVVGGANPTAVISSLTNLPGPVAQIAYLAPVPSSVLVNSPIKPPVRVILQDQYGNRVYQSGVQVRLTLRKANNTNSPNLLGGPVTVTTNANGLARFVGLRITAPGTYKFRAQVLNISGIPVILSNPFQVV
jgi:ELWxxDGT repeat protein